MMYVFRNNTVEQFFETDCQFSGYGDISFIPEADSYIWFYQVPLLVEAPDKEVDLIGKKLQYILNQLPKDKTIYVFTMENLFFSQIETGDVSLGCQIASFNLLVYRMASEQKNIRVIEFREFLSQCHESQIIDWRYFYSSQMPFNPKLINPFKKWWQEKLNQVAMKRKKCLVLDLDNTLWGGILGEDGVTGVKMSGDYPGKAFHYWQEGLLKLKESGVMLAVCSKNNEEDVRELWLKRKDMILKESDFVAKRVNWHNKADNINEIAQELNIGLDAFVFVDDNPSERELIKQVLPMVAVPEFPVYPFDLAVFYQQLVNDYFAVYQLTAEDRKKTEQYAANAARKQAEEAFTNIEDFLQSLDMHLTIQEIDDVSLARAAQMTQKTNQFNLTTHRYTEADLTTLLSKGANIYTLSVADKFGDYGITGLMIIMADGIVDTLLMSCRVLGKGIEDAFVKTVFSKLRNLGLSKVIGSYIPTAKNSIVKCFWPHLGFELLDQNDGAVYVLNLKNADLSIKEYYKIG